MELQRPTYAVVLTPAVTLFGCLGDSTRRSFGLSRRDPTSTACFDGCSSAPWAQGKAYGHWAVAVTGYGQLAVLDVDADRGAPSGGRTLRAPRGRSGIDGGLFADVTPSLLLFTCFDTLRCRASICSGRPSRLT